MENPQEQRNNREHLKKYQFKPGVSGNPGGRPKGSVSMKTFAQNYILAMPEEDRIEFLNSLDPKTIWEMAEGKAKQDLDLKGEVISKVIKLDIE